MKQTNNNINGIIIVNKVEDWTSHDVVAILRSKLGIKKIGHTGTLDPMATGVLPICIGQGTKVISYMSDDTKIYRCTMKLGIKTNTDDIWGDVTNEDEISNVKSIAEDKNLIYKVFEEFKGEISQIPPIYSALKVNGKKLYQYARNGEDVAIKPRKIYIHEIDIEYIDIENLTIKFTVHCSKGTYIRSICRDIGSALGTVATMESLERIKVGIFDISEALDGAKLKNMSVEEILEYLMPIDKPLNFMQKVILDKRNAERFLNGQKLASRDYIVTRDAHTMTKEQNKVRNIQNEYYRVYKYNKNANSDVDENKFLGIATITNNVLKVDKVFKQL